LGSLWEKVVESGKWGLQNAKTEAQNP
jgi:hypothetical protein